MVSIKKKIYPLITFLLLLHPRQLSDATGPKFIIWNVGQGQWLSLVSANQCTHYDMGGSHLEINKIKSLCINRVNLLYLSHVDWDHMNFIPRAQKSLGAICLNNLIELSPKLSLRKSHIIGSLQRCPKTSSFTKTIYQAQHKSTQSNHQSQVFLVDQKILIPGDSPQKVEKKWIKNIPQPSKIKFLILAHHGSQTSTSEALLKSLTGLKLAIASSQRSHYNHPHPTTMKKLRKYKIALITTEDWGTIVIEGNDNK